MASSELNETPALWLKANTRVEHLATEQTALATRLARGELSMRHFLCLLWSYRELHENVEREAASAGLGELLQHPRKSDWASADLDALGCEAADLPAQLTQVFKTLLHTESRAPVSREHILGRLYVMEGSALGAVMLGPTLERSLGLTTGLTYFRGAGAQTMPKWFAFRARLDGELYDGVRREQAKQGAVWQFGCVRTIFEVIENCAAETRLRSLGATGS